MKQILVFLSSFLFAISAQASEDVSVDKLSAQLSQIRTFQASFIQILVDKSGANIQETRGNIKAMRPGFFFWHVEPPLEQFVVSDGKTVTLYDPDLEQATIQSVTEDVANTPALLLSGNVEHIASAYRVMHVSNNAGFDDYMLIPQAEESLFESLRLRFENDKLYEMRMTDSLGQKSAISFTQITVNDDLTEKDFLISLPEGIDIIREGS